MYYSVSGLLVCFGVSVLIPDSSLTREHWAFGSIPFSLKARPVMLMVTRSLAGCSFQSPTLVRRDFRSKSWLSKGCLTELWGLQKNSTWVYCSLFIPRTYTHAYRFSDCLEANLINFSTPFKKASLKINSNSLFMAHKTLHVLFAAKLHHLISYHE